MSVNRPRQVFVLKINLRAIDCVCSASDDALTTNLSKRWYMIDGDIIIEA